MGRGGPQPAHQVTPGDLQLEEAVLDLEDPEIVEHLVPVCQLMSSLAVPPTEERICDVLGDEGDEDGDNESKDVDDEAIEDQDRVCEAPSRGIDGNLNNNAKKSRKSLMKHFPDVLEQVDMLLHQITYSHRGSTWRSVAQEQEPFTCSDEFMNKTHNNKYLSCIQEEDEKSEEKSNSRDQQKDVKNTKADPGVPAAELFMEATPKRRFNGSRRQVHGVWRGKVYESPRQTVLLQQVTMCGDGKCDYRELRKGMGDVVNETSELHNVATISDTDKAEFINEDCDFQSPGKLSIGPSALEEMDHTTAADFSSFLDPGSSCWNAENASQTTLIDEDTLSSSPSSQKVPEEPAIPQDADNVCWISPAIVPTPDPGELCFKEHLKTDTCSVKLNEQKPFLNNQVDKIFELPCAEGNKSSVSQSISSDEQSRSDFPDWQINAKTQVSPGPILPSIASSRVSTENFAKSRQHSSVKITPKSQGSSLVKELECNKLPESEISPRIFANYNFDNMTQNHSGSRPLHDSVEPVESLVKYGQGKCSKRSFTKRRNVCRVLKSSTAEAEEIHVAEQDTDVWADTVVNQHTLKAVDTVAHETRNVCEKETDKSGEDRYLLAQIRSRNTKSITFSVHDNDKFSVHNSNKHDTYSVHDNAKANAVLDHDNAKSDIFGVHETAKTDIFSVQDNAKSDIFSVHDNATPKVFSVQCQTSLSNLTSASVQCRISQSQALTEGDVAATAHVASVAAIDMYRTASNKVLNKLLISKRSHVLAESIRSFPYKSNDVQVSMASVHTRKRLRSCPKSHFSDRLPQITERNNACFSSNQGQTTAEYENVNITQLNATPSMYDNLSTDVCYHGSNEVSSNLTKEMSSMASVSPAVVPKTHISPQGPARALLLFPSSRLSSTRCPKVNANLNSTSSYLTPKGPTEDEVTVRISSDSQSVTNSRITPTSSTPSKITTASTITTQQEGNRGVISYFGNRFYKSSLQNGESSVDGDGYPFKKTGASSVREQASQTHEDEKFCVTPLRKEICHHFHIVSNYEDDLVEEQETQTNEFTHLRKDMNTISAPDCLSKRYSVEMPPASIAMKKKVVLPDIPEFQKEVKQANENTINVMSPIKKDYSFHQPDSFYVHTSQKDDSSKVRGEKKSHRKKQHEAKKKVLSHRYTQEMWERRMALDMGRPELNDTSIIMGSNIEHHQHAPPLGSENFHDTRTTYREAFRDPEIHRHPLNILDPPGQDSAGIRQKNTGTSHKHDETQGYEIYSSLNKSSDSLQPNREMFPTEAFRYAWQNKLRDQDSSKPFSDEPEASNRFRRSKTLPPTCTNPDVDGVFGDYMCSYRPPQCPDRWDLSYKTDGYPRTMIEQRKFQEPQLLPARVLAESYYDPSTNVISVVVKPVNVNLNHRLRNIKVKIYRSPPRLPPLTRVPKQDKEETPRRMNSSMPVSRNIIDVRAANPPFNTTTTQEADERYNRIFGHRKII